MTMSHDILTETPLRAVRSRPRVPPNLFGIAFGLAGLWNAASRTLGESRAVPDDLPRGRRCLARPGRRLRHAGRAPAAGGPAPPSSGPVRLAGGHHPDDPGLRAGHGRLCGRPCPSYRLPAATIAAGGWLTGQWIAG